ncbi:MAG TPA: ComEC/Rec2 family competence protein [Kiritimatiellia bacterium]|nr:ComEC/Rec2 family competence protein [Kiritimatiellia bacterium]HRZ11269.1 ComEC/Rec2 family competence protein [Kiritimatiellia bacterium]HSA19120.1 ComEC/Rec2 family competence protein [Kiritimatiellia bacterium]
MIQNKIIVFCYAYLLGIGLCMLAPLDVHFLPWLWLSVAIAFAFLVAQSYRSRLRAAVDPAPSQRGLWIGLVVAPLLLGYTRYVSVNTLPDSTLGMLEIRDGQPSFVATMALNDTSRLRLEKTEPLSADLRVRFVGEVRSRVPILSEQGIPTLDSEARWRFREVVTPQVSEVVEIKQNDPVGTSYVIPQPFNKIERVEVLSGPAAGRVKVHRVSNHIASFVRPGRNQTPVTLLARITSDPWLYSFKTVLTITPYYIQYRPDGPFFKVEGGDVRVTLGPDSDNYTQFACTKSYGYDIVVHGELTMASGKANPAGFDQRKYLNNYGVFGQMSVKQFLGGPRPLEAVAPAGQDLRTGNPLVELSLEIRDRLLRVFKQTHPYPSSAFMGGIALGLRYGLQSTECMYSSMNPSSGSRSLVGQHDDCRELIADEFRVAGVNHVLAVSGLHVTIITVMFVGIFTLLRMSRRVYVPIIVLALVIFAILTGARPSSLRAVIMNSLFLLTWAYMDKSLRSSVLLGVPVAALLILLENPNVMVDPSFSLSFMAILALALLTGPSYDVLCKFKGNDLVSLFLVIAFWTSSVIASWHLMESGTYWLLFVAFAGAVFGLGRLLTRLGIRLIGDRGFADIPIGISTFIAAQFAIQLGMMVPLSPFYFCRWPVAGAFANLIAIPLVGVVLQVGVIAAMIGLIPGIGIWIALLLNAADWVFGAGFLLIAHYCTKWFPYPLVARPTSRGLLLYFLLLALFVWWRPFYRWASDVVRARTRAGRARLGALVVLLVALFMVWVRYPVTWAEKSGLNITVLAVRYGSSILIQTPGGKNVLVDAAFVQRDRSRANEAERNIIVYLTTLGIRRLDGLILTSPRLERSSGIPYVLDRCRVDTFYTPPGLANLSTNITPEDFAAELGVPLEDTGALYPEIIGTPSAPRQLSTAKVLAGRGPTLVNRLAHAVIQHKTARAGDVLFREEVRGREFAIEVLSPDAEPFAEHNLDNQSLVLRVRYGDFAMLLPSDLHFAGQQRLLERYDAAALRSDVVVMPNRGVAMPGSFMVNMKEMVRSAMRTVTLPLFQKIAPKYAIFEFGNPKPVLGDLSRDSIKVYEIARREICDALGDDRVLNTDRDLTIFIRSDGTSCEVVTQAEKLRGTASEDFGSVDEMYDVP